MKIPSSLVTIIFVSLLLTCGAFAKGTKADLIITSSLPTPPPGYTIEKDLGSFFHFEVDHMFEDRPSNKFDVNRLVTKMDKVVQQMVKRSGGNAILNEHVDMRPSLSRGIMLILVCIQGEAVVLKRIEQKIEKSAK